MKRLQRSLLLAATVAIIIGVILVIEYPSYIAEEPVGTVPAGREVGIREGDVAPSFTLETSEGEKVSLTDFRGKVVFINFWATWCPFCVDEMPDIQRVHEEFGDSLVVLGINRAESVDKQMSFLNDFEVELTYTILLDLTDSVASRYGVRAMPTSYFLNSEGVIVRRYFGQISLDDMREAIRKAGATPSSAQISEEEEVKVMVTNGVKHIVPLDKVLSGGPPKDGIPSIDEPKFISVSEADEFLNDEDLVLGIYLNGEAKAYPEDEVRKVGLVNDIIGGTPILVIYNLEANIVKIYERTVDGATLEFKLENGDLVDIWSGTRWSHSGEGLSGKYAGEKLSEVISPPDFWFAWAAFYSDTELFIAE